MRIVGAVLALAMCAAGMLPAEAQEAGPSDSNVLYVDDFTDATAGQMPQRDTAQYHLAYDTDAGEYIIQTIDPNWGRLAEARLPADYTDTLLTVDARLVGDMVNRYIALACRAQDSGAHYRLSVDLHGGRVRLARWDSSTQAVALVDWKAAASILPDDQTNHIEFLCARATIAARINGQVVASVSDATLASGAAWLGAGLFSGANGLVEAHFASLQVSEPSDADVAALAPPPVSIALPTATPLPPAAPPTPPPPTAIAKHDYTPECQAFANTLPGRVGDKVLLISNIVLSCTYYADRDGAPGLQCFEKVLQQELTDNFIYTAADFDARYRNCMAGS